MAIKKVDPLKSFVSAIKNKDKAAASPDSTLARIIDDYCESGEFDAFLYAHRHKLAGFLNDQQEVRPTRYRASSAGECSQAQAYDALEKVKAEAEGLTVVRGRVKRPARTIRAMYNGTFFHLRAHLIFDALHINGTVKTKCAEVTLCNMDTNVSGTVDRGVEWMYGDKAYDSTLDFKSIKHADFGWLKKAQPKHRDQQHALRLAGHESERWTMLYEDKDTHEMKIYTSTYSDLIMHSLKRMYAKMDAWIDEVMKGVPVEERTKLDLKPQWCKWCPHQKACKIEHPDLEEQQRKYKPEEELEEVVF